MARRRENSSDAAITTLYALVLLSFILTAYGLRSETLDRVSSHNEDPPSESFSFPEENELIEDENNVVEEKAEQAESVDDEEETLPESKQDIAEEEEEEEDIVMDNCCTRQKKMLLIGVGDTGDEVFVDEGQCRRTCGRHAHNHHHHPGGKRWTDEDFPVQSSHLACGSTGICEAASTRQETRHLLQGTRTVSVVTSCACVKRPLYCERQEKRLVYFPHSPFETQVDVGVCRGPCASDSSCKPLRNKTVSVDGPNGNICVQVIEDCACASSCYRLQTYEVYFDHVWNSSTNISERVTKKIDVGRCVGECTGGSRHHCVLRDRTNSSICLMSLTKRQSTCVPTGFKTHRLSPNNDQEITVLAVTKCGCD